VIRRAIARAAANAWLASDNLTGLSGFCPDGLKQVEPLSKVRMVDEMRGGQRRAISRQ
jgi:hypothetical protein